jgi:DNA-binding transcriptional ArsR family regulator
MNVIWTHNMKPFEAEAHFFKLLMHPTRLEILDELRKDEACVCHLEAKLGYRQAYISQHIMVLREAGVLQDRREGWNIFYHVTKPEIFQLMDSVSQLMGAGEKGRRAARAAQVPCPCPKCNPGESAVPCSKEVAARKKGKVAVS